MTENVSAEKPDRLRDLTWAALRFQKAIAAWNAERHEAVRALADGADPFRRLVRVIALHAPNEYGYCKGCTGDEPPRWDDCPTIAAIKGDQ